MSDRDDVRLDDQDKSGKLVNDLKEFLVPTSDAFHCRGTTFAGYSRPVAECGGDWWTARKLANGKILVLIADVMGHDLRSAVIMGVGKAVCDLACAESESVVCTELLETMNRSIFEAGNQGKVTMTCFVSVVDPDTRIMSFASAGHPQPLLFHRGPDGIEIRVVQSIGTPLGLDAHGAFRTQSIQLHQGDLLFWYTDGVTECRNREHKRLSERQLVRFLTAEHARSPMELRDELVNKLDCLHESAPPDDDITFVLARIG